MKLFLLTRNRTILKTIFILVMAIGVASLVAHSTSWAQTTTSTPPTVIIPNAPGDLRLDPVPTTNTIFLRWNDNSTDEDVFYVDRKFVSDSNYAGTLHWAQLPANTTTFTDTNVVAGQHYDYRVQACNSAGCSMTSRSDVVTAPETPTCTSLSFALVNSKTSYTIGESVNYSYGCLPAGTSAASITVQSTRNDGTVLWSSTFYSNSENHVGSTLQLREYSTSGLSVGAHTLRACLNSPACTTGINSIQFMVVAATLPATAVPGAGTPEPTTNDAIGAWAQVDVVSGQIVGTAVCTRSVCGLNGDWHGYVPPVSHATGAVWWPTSKRYIWQLPGSAGYGQGTFDFNTFIFTVLGGTIYNGQFTPTVATSTPPSPPPVTPTSTAAFTPTSTSAIVFPPTIPVYFTPSSTAPIQTPVIIPPLATTTITTTLAAPVVRTAPEVATVIVSPQSSFVGSSNNSEQFLVDRRAALQDLRVLERLVKRDIIEVDAKQLKIFKEKILSLKPDKVDDTAVLQAYREQIAFLRSDNIVTGEFTATVDPLLEVKALKQLKQGLVLFGRHVATIEKKVTQIEKSGIIVDTSIKEMVVFAKDLVQRVKNAKTYNEVQDVAEQMPDVAQALNDDLPRLEELGRLPQIFRLINQQITNGEKAITQAGVAAKRLKLDVSEQIEKAQGLVGEAKSATADLKNNTNQDDLLGMFDEQVLFKLEQATEITNNIRAVTGVQKTINGAAADVKIYEARLRRLKANDEEVVVAVELLNQFKAELTELKKVVKQRLTATVGEQIIERLDTMSELKNNLEDALGISTISAVQKQIKQLFSAPAGKINPFKVEYLEQGVL